ncbi:MAG: class I mannose-6-phosphate isomerase [Anaerolineales bacterium]|nr:MAG: class I mannose-6-phosphate isomerase [Anaerolineales bacterium]
MLYPLTFTPALRDYIWGGRNLETLYGRQLPPGPIAESWEISGHPNAATLVDAGPLSGHSLPDVLTALGTDLVGSRAGWALERGKFPLLVKLLDAEKRLSVQVHPPDDYALVHADGELGKTEMWYILHARPGAQLIFGLRPGVTPELFRQAIAEETLETCLHYLPVEAGQAVFLPTGTVHAMMEGIVAAEVQQNSDTTYRVYDWGRLGADGRPRPLHVDRALEVINFQQVEPGAYQPRWIATQHGVARYEISRSDYFVVEKVSMSPGAVYTGRTDGQTLEIWGTVQGKAELAWAGEPVTLASIRFCLVPAGLGDFEVRALGPATMLRVYLP